MRALWRQFEKWHGHLGCPSAPCPRDERPRSCESREAHAGGTGHQRAGVHPNALARGLISKQTDTVGVLMPDISNPYAAEVVKGMKMLATRSAFT